MPKTATKLYCYVDETGQDAGSKFFVVVNVVSGEEQESLRQNLIRIETTTKLGAKKWHSSRSPEKEAFMRAIVAQDLAKGDLYYGKFKKPLPFFLPLLEVVEKAIKSKAGNKAYQAIVYVDGIDKKKVKELTGGLRLKGIKLKYVRSARDESEPMIRLADRWAGCIRDALEGKTENIQILSRAEKDRYVKHLK